MECDEYELGDQKQTKMGSSMMNFYNKLEQTENTRLQTASPDMREIKTSKCEQIDRVSELIRQEQSKKQTFEGSCFSKLYDDSKFQSVSGGPILSKMQGIFLKGRSVLKKEIEHCKQIPAASRIIIMDHHINEDGEGEPEANEIIISRHVAKRSKVFK